ncbi:SAVMC3_10250 family protein [Streptomyces sp. NPDC058049]|uniref:SAVMC3_10250 family protein n=1 Tax=Streptomyces sp. NPDC058049 TaxID=3346314 RepID=UPI0036EB1E8B
MRQLLYLSVEKLRDFHSSPQHGFTHRVREIEASLPVVGGVRLALAPREGSAAGPSLDSVIDYLRRTWPAETSRPDSCADLIAWDWLQFAGRFLHGPRSRDSGSVDQGVYTFMSMRGRECGFDRGEEECADIELILCGSRQHVSIEDDCPATRMGSGSDWLHDLAAELNASVERGDHALPLSLSSADVSDQEFAARSAYDMMADYRGGPAYLQGHARVLCNFPPGRFRHRMIVATPLYVEAGQTPQARAVAASGSSSRAWRRWARSVRGWRARTSGRG